MQQSYTFASFTSQHTSQSLQKSGLPNRTDTASQWTAKPRQKEGKLVTRVWHNSGFCASYGRIMVGSSAVIRLNFCAKNPPLRQAAKSYTKCLKRTIQSLLTNH